MKALMRSAGKSGAAGIFIMGNEELAKGTVQFKNFSDGTQQELPVAKAVDFLNQFTV